SPDIYHGCRLWNECRSASFEGGRHPEVRAHSASLEGRPPPQDDALLPAPLGAVSRPMPKILLAEDDNDMRRFLVKALETAGFEVTDYDNGLAAYRRLREEPFELLLTDIVMPEMDGIELARRASELRSEEHTSELQSRVDLVCRLLLEKKKEKTSRNVEQNKKRVQLTSHVQTGQQLH